MTGKGSRKVRIIRLTEDCLTYKASISKISGSGQIGVLVPRAVEGFLKVGDKVVVQIMKVK